MNRASLVFRLSLFLGLVCATQSFAEDKSPADWEKQSLKGITSIRYGVAEGGAYEAMDDVAAALSGVKVPAKRLPNLKKDYANPLSTTEARVKVVAQDREDNQCWVGLSVDQRCLVKRLPSINLDSETYRLGKMCPKAQVKTAVKEACAEFVRDFTAQAKKK